MDSETVDLMGWLWVDLLAALLVVMSGRQAASLKGVLQQLKVAVWVDRRVVK